MRARSAASPKPTSPPNDTNAVSLCVGQTPGQTPDLIFTVGATASLAAAAASEGRNLSSGCHDPSPGRWRYTQRGLGPRRPRSDGTVAAIVPLFTGPPPACEAERQFRRIIGYRDLAKLTTVIDRELDKPTVLTPIEEAAIVVTV
jgi:hypothetical protein